MLCPEDDLAVVVAWARAAGFEVVVVVETQLLGEGGGAHGEGRVGIVVPVPGGETVVRVSTVAEGVVGGVETVSVAGTEVRVIGLRGLLEGFGRRWRVLVERGGGERAERVAGLMMCILRRMVEDGGTLTATEVPCFGDGVFWDRFVGRHPEAGELLRWCGLRRPVAALWDDEAATVVGEEDSEDETEYVEDEGWVRPVIRPAGWDETWI